ncbi:MAG: ribose-phosphate pyrophosphokinase-like domain-containing protein [Candidatus Komeilibacteria bacterium]
MINRDRLVLYSGTSNFSLAETTLDIVSQRLNQLLTFTHVYHDPFNDGEPGFELELPEQINGRHAILFASVIDNKHELQLRDMITACKFQYGARSVTVIMPFMRYRKQDHPEFTNEITRLRWYLKGLKDQGVDNLLVCDPHNLEITSTFAREFGLNLFIADPSELFAREVSPLIQSYGPETVFWYSPDFGSVGRAITMAKLTNTRVMATAKERRDGEIQIITDDTFLDRIYRQYGDDVQVMTDLEALNGMNVFMREDEVASGSTCAHTAKHLRQKGVNSLRLVATHPVCSHGWKRRLFPRKSPHPFDKVIVGNTRRRGFTEQTVYEVGTGGHIITVDTAPELARRLVEVLETLHD